MFELLPGLFFIPMAFPVSDRACPPSGFAVWPSDCVATAAIGF